MTNTGITELAAHLRDLAPVHHLGRVAAAGGGVIRVRGLGAAAHLGDHLTVMRRGGAVLVGEVLRLDADHVVMLPDGPSDGVRIGDPVRLSPPPAFAPADSWIGRVIDPYGRPLDGGPLFRGQLNRPLRAAPPDPARRRPLGRRLRTGLSVFDTLLPLVAGQRLGLFAGPGVGKSSLMAHFARAAEADVVVLAMIGERGRELRVFVDDVLGPEGMARSVVVAATSDRSALVRRRCAWAALTVAEHFRDQGAHVLLLADSVTRFAEAHREVAASAGEAPVLRGYPASLAHMIMSLCERAGPGTDETGDITALFSVLVAGSDMDEPVADILRGVLDGHVILDRGIAERGRFPAVDLLRSVSRSLPGAANGDENALIAQARHMLAAFERAEPMLRAGLYAPGNDPDTDRAVALHAALDAFLAAPSEGAEAAFASLRDILSPDAAETETAKRPALPAAVSPEGSRA